jgi:hypothetical protein
MSADLLPEGSMLLHIGPYKTGTTAIQQSLYKHRSDLVDHGVLYPGSGPRQRRASWAAVGRSPRGAAPVGPSAWQKMLDEVASSSATRFVVSSEDFTSADTEAVRGIVDDLGRDRVHVLMVIRALDRLLPSSWQQRVKSARETLTLDDWLREVLDRPDGWKGRTFWKNQGVHELVERYAAHVPRERISILVADETDHTQQMRVFESLLGLPTGLLTPGEHQNTSLSLERTEFLRRVNALADERGWNETLLRGLVHGGMLRDLRTLPPEPGERRIPGLPTWSMEPVAALNVARAEHVRASGCRVIGDPAVLANPPQASEQVPPVEHISVAVAAAAVAGAVDAAGRRDAPSPTRRRPTATAVPRAARNPTSEPTTSARRVDRVPAGELVRELGRRARRRVRRGR